MLNKAESLGVITGVPSSKKGPRLSHLFFADDSLLFCKANSVEWRRITNILEKYEEASGQKLNKDKTSIFFSRNTSPEKKEEISRLSGLSATQCYEKYLGLPTMVGRSRYQAFKSIKDRVWSRLNDWKVKFLSQAGKEILIKAVVQAIPTYSMSVFLLPNSLCKELNGLMQRFWWGHKENNSKIHWMSWEKMGVSKEQGRLGFRDLIMFNKALLAKQVWRIMKNPESLTAKIMKAKYFPHSSIMEASMGNRPSQAWRSVLAAKDLVHSGAIWRVGDGHSIRVWGDKWIPTPSSFSIQSPRGNQMEDWKVSHLIDQDTKQWNSSLVNTSFIPEEASTILNIPLSPFQPKDRLIWRCTKNGEFTVKNAYHLGMEMRDREKAGSSGGNKKGDLWKACWSLKVPNAVKMFVWRACHNLLPTRANLFRKGVCEDKMCPICVQEEEIVAHVSWGCPAANDVWGGASRKLQKCDCDKKDFAQIFSEIASKCDKDEVELFAVLARRLWLRRNDVVHGGILTHPNQIMRDAEAALEEFRRVNTVDGQVQQETMETHDEGWSPPPETTIKINWDASLDKIRRIVGMGMIARDGRGSVIAAATKVLFLEADPVVAETLAATHALIFCHELGLQHVIF
jgi:hypothetical protein